MQYRQKISYMMLLILLFVVPATTSQTTSDTGPISDLLQFQPTLVEINEDASAINLPVERTLTQYVIFADNDHEFIDLKKMDTLRTYELLQAVVVELKGNEYSILGDRFKSRIFPYSAYEKQQFETKHLPLTSSISLNNGFDDADILGVSPLWDLNYNGSGVVVGVYDNGVQADHPGLSGQVLQRYSVSEEGYLPCKDHGTPVSGNIASTGKVTNGSYDPNLRGMAFGSKIISVELGCGEGQAVVGDYLGGFEWLLAQNETIDVINASWGGWGLGLEFAPLIKRIVDAGMIFVSSAGNSGPSENTIFTPADLVDTITAGAISYNMDVTSFSSRGPAPGLSIKPDVLAPGQDVVTTQLGGGYGPIDGTSFSSPLTAGAIATIISALNQNGIPYNPGAIKAALLNNATSLGETEIVQGKGVLNAYATFMNLKNQFDQGEVGADGVPYAIDMSPRLDISPTTIYKKVFKELEMDIPFSLFSSHMDETIVQITGSLAEILSFDSTQLDEQSYNKVLDLHVNTIGKAQGVYSGELVIKLGSKAKMTAQYQITVTPPAKGKILMDLRHTAYDEVGGTGYGGFMTYEFMNLVYGSGYWIEPLYEEISETTLSDADILWVTNPLEMEMNFFPLLESEINAIESFVNAGGSLFVDFEGLIEYEDYEVTVGGQMSEINKLLGKFDIQASEVAVKDGEIENYATLKNVTGLVGKFSKIPHFGNSLTVSGSANVLAETASGKATMAFNDIINGGRVLVSSTHAWFGNQAINGDSVLREDGADFILRVLNWLNSEYQVKFLSSEYTDESISGTFKIRNNGQDITSVPTITLIDTDLIAGKTITPQLVADNIWSFNLALTGDGHYSIITGSDEEYAHWELFLDRNPPNIYTNPANANRTTFDRPTSSFFLKFFVNDTVSEIKKNYFSIKLDGENLSEDVNLSYRSSDQVLSLLFMNPRDFDEVDSHIYDLAISVSDTRNNSITVHYYFNFDDYSVFADPTSESENSETPFLGLELLILIPIMVPVLRKMKGYT
ncbi:MAG: S8 family serine peptidase [Candidatus Heimdallarchaeota archaeon]|nr:S8 family serine peptidase [Candidatus Heimdallarchaeota archaeon]